MSLLFQYLLIGVAILLPLGIVKYLLRERYARQLLAGNEAQMLRVLQSSSAMLKRLKWFLYLSPLILVAVPLGLYIFAHEKVWLTIIFTLLMVITGVLEYFYRRWLYKRLRSAIS